MRNIAILGSGNIGVALAALLYDLNYKVTIISSRATQRSNGRVIKLHKPDGSTSFATVDVKRDLAEVQDIDCIISTVPGNALALYTKSIDRYAKTHSQKKILCIGVYGGSMFCYNMPDTVTVACFERVPFICRKDSDVEVHITGWKKSLKLWLPFVNNEMWTSKNIPSIVRDFEVAFNTTISFAKCKEEVTFTNSNGLLHTARLYELITSDVSKPQKFYADWGDDASTAYFAMDLELRYLVQKLQEQKHKTWKTECARDHYDVQKTEELAKKMQSITSLQNIECPGKWVDGRFILDKTSRYFEEDVLITLKHYIDTAKMLNLMHGSVLSMTSVYETIMNHVMKQ